MNIISNTDRNSFTAKQRIASWASHDDPYMVVLSEQAQFLALAVIIAYLSAYKDGSRHNTFLASHGWAKTFLNHRKGSEMRCLNALEKYLSTHPKQVAQLLESEHILISQDDRETRLRRAYRYFQQRGATGILDAVDGYRNAVSLYLEELRYEQERRQAAKRERLMGLRNLVERVKALKAKRDYLKIVGTARDLLGLDATATGTFHGIDLRHWRYLVAPLE